MAGIKAGADRRPALAALRIRRPQVTHQGYTPAEICKNAVEITAGFGSQGPGVGKVQLIFFI